MKLWILLCFVMLFGSLIYSVGQVNTVSVKGKKDANSIPSPTIPVEPTITQVTNSDNGESIVVHSESIIDLSLHLDKKEENHLSVEDPHILTLKQPLTYDASSNIFRAKLAPVGTSGQTKITVMSTPFCARGSMCPQFIIQSFSLVVRVEQ